MYLNEFKIKIEKVIEYINLLNKTDRIRLHDEILTEMVDLLYGIAKDDLFIPQRGLASTYYCTDGAVKDKHLETLIYEVQKEIDRNKRKIKIGKNYQVLDQIASFILGVLIVLTFSLTILSFQYHSWPFILSAIICAIMLIVDLIVDILISKYKKNYSINFFPNLQNPKYKVICYEYIGEDIMDIYLDNGLIIDLGYYETENIYIITVANTSWNKIYEEVKTEKRYEIEKNIVNFINKYEKEEPSI